MYIRIVLYVKCKQNTHEKNEKIGLNMGERKTEKVKEKAEAEMEKGKLSRVESLTEMKTNVLFTQVKNLFRGKGKDAKKRGREMKRRFNTHRRVIILYCMYFVLSSPKLKLEPKSKLKPTPKPKRKPKLSLQSQGVSTQLIEDFFVFVPPI
jgi:hypothetical protein